MPTDTPKSSKMTTLEAAIADSDRLDARPSTAICEFCFAPCPNPVPDEWDFVWQSYVCPACIPRVKADGGYAFVPGGKYATRPDPRAKPKPTPSTAAERLKAELNGPTHYTHTSVNLADLRTVLAERERYRAALAEIIAVEPPQFVLPADWQEQIAACPECQGWAKDHPIQRGICDLHRKPLWARENHDKYERGALIYRAKDVARSALAPAAGGGGETTTAPTE